MGDKDKTKGKRRFIPDVRIGGGGLDVAALRGLAQSEPAAFVEKFQGLIEKEGLRWGAVTNLRNFFAAFDGIEVPTRMEFAGVTREVTASAFPLLCGGLTIAGINDAYEALPTIGQDLVTELDDAKRFTVLASVTSLNADGTDKVDENQDFPEIGAGEEKFTIANRRNGRRLSITSEVIEENDVAGIVQKIDGLAEIASETIEEQTLRRVTDHDGSASSGAEPYVYHLNGSAAALYTTTTTAHSRAPSGTRLQNTGLQDTSDLEAARAVLAAMKNSRGKRINIPMSRCKLLVPDNKVGVASSILKSRLLSGVENEVSNWGPEGSYRPTLVSSPKLDDLSTTAWYLGDFQRQFRRKWKLRFEYVTLTGIDTEAFLRRRIAYQARVAWDCEVGAVDHVFVVQCLNGTTAPKNE